jgi:hypothetical protein
MSLNLSARLAPQFTRNVRHRGEEYYWHDQVRIERASESELHARVRGSQTYDVELNFRTEPCRSGVTAPTLWTMASHASISGPRFWQPRHRAASLWLLPRRNWC